MYLHPLLSTLEELKTMLIIDSALLETQPAKTAVAALDSLLAVVASQTGEKGVAALAVWRKDALPAQLVDAALDMLDQYLRWGTY